MALIDTEKLTEVITGLQRTGFFDPISAQNIRLYLLGVKPGEKPMRRINDTTKPRRVTDPGRPPSEETEAVRRMALGQTIYLDIGRRKIESIRNAMYAHAKRQMRKLSVRRYDETTVEVTRLA